MVTRAFDDEDRGKRKAEALLRDLEWFHKLLEAYLEEDFELGGLSVRFPKFEGDDYFAVIRASRGGEKLVAFVDGEDFVDVLRRVVRQLKVKKLKFREDNYE